MFAESKSQDIGQISVGPHQVHMPGSAGQLVEAHNLIEEFPVGEEGVGRLVGRTPSVPRRPDRLELGHAGRRRSFGTGSQKREKISAPEPRCERTWAMDHSLA